MTDNVIMKTNLLIILSVFLLTSCAATVVKSTKHKSKYAPANYQETGAVQYSMSGADDVIELRREDAFKKMYDECDGAYVITREGRKSEFMAVTDYEMGTHYIEFRCTVKAASN